MSARNKKMVYVFDLDGTLCDTQNGDYYNSIPLPKRIALLNILHRRGHTIIIDTARGSETGINWRVVTQNQLREWGVEYDVLRCGHKIAADAYIDDRAINIKDFKL